jgi:hypothetical protein
LTARFLEVLDAISGHQENNDYLNKAGDHTAALLATLSNGETFIVRGWFEHANAAFAVNPPLVEGSVRIPIHLVKIGVGTLM